MHIVVRTQRLKQLLFAALALLCCVVGMRMPPVWAQTQAQAQAQAQTQAQDRRTKTQLQTEPKAQPEQQIQDRKPADEATDGDGKKEQPGPEAKKLPEAKNAPEAKNLKTDGREKSNDQEKSSPASEQAVPKKSGTPLVVAGEEVFAISVMLGGYSPQRRVQSISTRLQQLENEPHFKEKVEQITTRDNDFSTDIMAGDLTIMTVTSLDARAEGVASREELAQAYAGKLKAVLKKYIEEHSLKNRLTSVGLTGLATIALFLLLGLTNWLFPRSYRVIFSWQGKHIRELKIQRSRLLSQETLTDILIGTLRIVRVLLVLLLLSLYVTVVLSFFPETRDLSGDIVKYFTFPIQSVIWPALLVYLPNIAFLIVILSATYFVIIFTHFLFREIERGNISIDGFDPEWAESTYKIARLLIIAFAFVLIFPYLPGSGSPAFQQVSLFMGVLLSLGSTGAMSHVVAGVFLTYTGAFKIGDRVKIADTVGDVIDKTLLATRIRTIKNEYITIPNALVLGSHIINYSS